MEVRVRYAPSPTGAQHIGGVRTALFNYFFARSSRGKFLLRIEDTDQARYDKESEKDLYDTLAWLGIVADESPQAGGEYGPYVQSKRSQLYRDYAQKLVDEGKAYKCYCSAERLERIRKLQEANKMPTGYDRHCAHLSEAEKAESERKGLKAVVRLAVPTEGHTVFEDYLLGRIVWPNKDISPDPILLKSDGLPTYHLANVIDDHFMKISHVLRAQEWLPSGPFHMRLYEAFGWQAPVFCHLPMVVGSDGQKLSKRHGATSLKQFRDKGYLPEAIINYVTLLGWSYDDRREFFTKKELEEVFSLDRLKKSPAIFDYKKLDFYNAHYIRQLDAKRFEAYAFQELNKAGYTTYDQAKVKEALPLIQERVKKLEEIPQLLRFLLHDVETWHVEELLGKKLDLHQALVCLKELLILVPGYSQRSGEENEQLIREKAKSLALPFSVLMVLLRVVVLGSRVSPPLFDSMKLLAEEEVLARITGAIGFLKKQGEKNG